MSSKTLTLAERGRKGGLAVVKKYGKDYMREIGSEGGLATAETYGSQYMSAIGTLGANAINGHLSPSGLLKTQRLARRIIRENQ
jgi:hypothetical protein